MGGRGVCSAGGRDIARMTTAGHPQGSAGVYVSGGGGGAGRWWLAVCLKEWGRGEGECVAGWLSGSAVSGVWGEGGQGRWTDCGDLAEYGKWQCRWWGRGGGVGGRQGGICFMQNWDGWVVGSMSVS